MNLYNIFYNVRKQLALFIIIPLACALIAGIVSYGFMNDQYKAKVKLFVEPQVSLKYKGLTTDDIATAKLNVVDLENFVGSDAVVEKVEQKLNIEDLLEEYEVTTDSDTNTRFIDIVVHGDDPQKVTEVANTIAEELQIQAEEYLGYPALSVYKHAKVPEEPSYPSRAGNVITALFLGLIVAFVLVLAMAAFDKSVRSEDDVEKDLRVPYLGEVPPLKNELPSISEFIQSDNIEKFTKHLPANIVRSVEQIIVNSKFMTNNHNNVMTVTSSKNTDGAQSLSILIASLLARTNNVLLINVSDNKEANDQDIYSLLGRKADDNLVAVQISEDLLTTNSEQNKIDIEKLRDRFDFIIFNTPALAESVNAMVTSAKGDVTLLAVRKSETDVRVASRAVAQLQNAQPHLLGVVLTQSKE